jgi:hypothetical protein
MALSDKEFRKLKFGLALKKFMVKPMEEQPNVDIDTSNKTNSENQNIDSISFRALETASGIPHPSIVQIVNGKKNASWSTVTLLLDGLEINLSQFAFVYDNLSEQEVKSYFEEISTKNLDRIKKKRFQGKKSVEKDKSSKKRKG